MARSRSFSPLRTPGRAARVPELRRIHRGRSPRTARPRPTGRDRLHRHRLAALTHPGPGRPPPGALVGRPHPLTASGPAPTTGPTHALTSTSSPAITFTDSSFLLSHAVRYNRCGTMQAKSKIRPRIRPDSLHYVNRAACAHLYPQAPHHHRGERVVVAVSGWTGLDSALGHPLRVWRQSSVST